MDKLISMVDFVINESKIGMEVQSISHQLQNRANRFEKIVSYANFLKQPLILGMFVACDLDGTILEEPEKVSAYDCTIGDHSDMIKYQEAKDRVLFEGFKVYKEKSRLIKVFNSESNIELYLPNNNKIERLAFGKIVLTESARKQIGL